MSYIPLFEYGPKEKITNSDEVKRLLKNVWNQKKYLFELSNIENITDDDFQPFLQFDGEFVRANNFVGFIQSNDKLIEIYPKVFRNNPFTPKMLMLKHIFYWFQYCRKWKFPFTNAYLDTINVEKFPELIIFLIANQVYDTIYQQPLMLYHQVEETLVFPKGTINYARYIQQQIGIGNFHKIECDHEPFTFDNSVNQIIKHCTRLLIKQTNFPETLKILQDILFILDEVKDVSCTLDDILKIRLNNYYEDYNSLMENCKIILENQLYTNNLSDLSQWCILFPMEYIFEDFVAGFIEKHFSNRWKIEYQKSDLYLSCQPRVFNLQHDILLTSKLYDKRILIVDTKYKIRDFNFKDDKKKGIDQNDLYQIISYAFIRGCSEVFLIYPNVVEKINQEDVFEIISGFPSKEKITVTAFEIPFWSINDFQNLEKTLYNVMEKRLATLHIPNFDTV